jgi:hypothetical protein
VEVKGGFYTHVRGLPEGSSPEVAAPAPERLETQAMLKNTASIVINFEAKLREAQAKGIPYASINQYLRATLSADQVGLFNLRDLMTYGRGESEKTYSDAYTALRQIPGTIDMSGLYSVVEGLPY